MTTLEINFQRVADHLSQLEGVRSGMVVRRDGSPVSGVITGEDEDLLGAIAGAICATVNRALLRTGMGDLRDVIITSSHGMLQAMAADDFVLVVLAEPASNAGMIRLELRRAAQLLQPEIAQ